MEIFNNEDDNRFQRNPSISASIYELIDHDKNDQIDQSHYLKKYNDRGRT